MAAIDISHLQSYDKAPLEQVDSLLGDAIRNENADRRRKIEERKQRKLKKRKRVRRQQQDD
jgi:hypothetical protein